MASQVKDPSRAIFNLHCPPYGAIVQLDAKKGIKSYQLISG
jgi:Icc-related predicted phosphoesterase